MLRLLLLHILIEILTTILTPEKNIETMPCWGKNSSENCLVDLGRDTRTSTQSRRLVRRKGASWSLNWPSGANSLAHLQLK